MKKAQSRLAVAAVFTLGFASLAQAVPIYFDFTGTISVAHIPGSGGELQNAPISAGFTIETESLIEWSVTSPSIARIWEDSQTGNPAEPWARLSFGGRDIAFPAGTGFDAIDLAFGHACTPAGCTPGQAEYFRLGAFTTDLVPPDFTGSYSFRGLTFSSAAIVQLENSFTSFDYFDITAVDPTSIVSLPLHVMTGFYVEETLDCVAGACTTTSSGFVGFNVDSVTRGIGTRSVPEPGTLGLLGAGLLAVLLMRRRTSRQQQA